MAEATYFERPNLKVTSSEVITEVRAFRTDEIRRVRWYHGVAAWYSYGFLVLSICILAYRFIGGNALTELGLPADLASLVQLALLILVLWVVKPTYRVKMEGSFGKVEFDCGTDFRCTLRLVSALRRVTGIDKKGTSNVPGVA